MNHLAGWEEVLLALEKKDFLGTPGNFRFKGDYWIGALAIFTLFIFDVSFGIQLCIQLI